jgi:hypothetical protein
MPGVAWPDDDQVGAQGGHGHLHQLAGDAGDRGHRHRFLGHRLLHLGHLGALGVPAADQCIGHAHGLGHFGVGHGLFQVTLSAAGLALHLLDGLAGHAVVGIGQAQHQQPADQGRQPEPEVGHGDDDQEDQCPGRIHQRHDALGREQVAQAPHIAQRFAVGVALAPGGHRQGEAGDLRRHGVVDDVAQHALQPAAQIVQRAHQDQRHGQAEHQYQQGFGALAGEHPVKHLEAEQGRCEPEQVDRGGEAGDGAKE